MYVLGSGVRLRRGADFQTLFGSIYWTHRPNGPAVSISGRQPTERPVSVYQRRCAQRHIQSSRLQGTPNWKQVKCSSARERHYSLGSPGKQSLKWKRTFSLVPKDQTWGLSWWRTCLQCRRPGFIPGLGRSPGEGNAAHSSILRLRWWLSWWRIPPQCGRPGFIPGLGRSPGEGNATHSSILAWRIPWTV